MNYDSFYWSYLMHEGRPGWRRVGSIHHHNCVRGVRFERAKTRKGNFYAVTIGRPGALLIPEPQAWYLQVRDWRVIHVEERLPPPEDVYDLQELIRRHVDRALELKEQPLIGDRLSFDNGWGNPLRDLASLGRSDEPEEG